MDKKPVTLTEFLAARLAEDWSAARDRELAAGLRESRGTRDVDAKRAILALCVRVIEEDADEAGNPRGYSDGWSGLRVVQDTLRQMGAVYSDHPDYQQLTADTPG